ncbi:MAG: hypothetical protein DI598_11165 [Pseudopedobacter saltans]|uniref:Tetracycline regulation of excision, RteC n=1 Tax=Pseudopedobacter saltans TaxID=151895 RepID=A0A2W5GVB1_9SPHI|nr:MAG: hypothetical protein DI598_11165 [Pseudopedobacter saltans]
MENFLKQLWADYQEKTELLDRRELNARDKHGEHMKIVLSTLFELKSLVYQHEFPNKEEQIRYHKHQVPKFMAELVFLVHAQRLETAIRMVSGRVRRKFLDKEKRDINRFFEKNLQLSQYLSGDNNYLDEKLFLQEGVQMEFPFLDESAFVLESRFITGTGYTIARILAYGKLISYLNELGATDSSMDKDPVTVSPLNWTDTGMSLTEIAYALKYSGAVNKGNVDVKEIAEVLGRAFNTRPVNVYRNKQDLYSRKNQSMFLDRLRKELIRGLEESDNG